MRRFEILTNLENHAYEVTKCFSAHGWSVVVACIKEMTTGIYALVMTYVSVERWHV